MADIENDTKLSIALVAPPPQIDSRLFIAYGASEREYGAEDSSINLMPPESSGRYHESLLLKTLGFWRNILLLFVVTFIAGFTFASLFLSKQETALLKQKFSLQGSVDQRVQQVQSLLDEAKSFNVLASAVKEAASQRSHIKDKLAMIEREVVLSGLVLNSLDLRGSELVMILNGPTRKNILNFKEKLEKAGISVIIPPAQLAPEKNLTVNATVKI
ncbi:hypothetical protein HY967_02240 [Candidatus Jorgensenbacteria bacterium]|nr:hypothetical protein [Candidatus Jorgensenbacteria bacterium]